MMSKMATVYAIVHALSLFFSVCQQCDVLWRWPIENVPLKKVCSLIMPHIYDEMKTFIQVLPQIKNRYQKYMDYTSYDFALKVYKIGDDMKSKSINVY